MILEKNPILDRFWIQHPLHQVIPGQWNQFNLHINHWWSFTETTRMTKFTPVIHVLTFSCHICVMGVWLIFAKFSPLYTIFQHHSTVENVPDVLLHCLLLLSPFLLCVFHSFFIFESSGMTELNFAELKYKAHLESLRYSNLRRMFWPWKCKKGIKDEVKVLLVVNRKGEGDKTQRMEMGQDTYSHSAFSGFSLGSLSVVTMVTFPISPPTLPACL